MQSFFNAIIQVFVDLMVALELLLKDIFYWVIDTVLDFVIPLLDTVGQTLTFNPATYINAMPAETVNFMAAVGIGEATTIIVAALTVRLILQLIPFTRLGS